MITSENYVENVIRTEASDLEAITKRLSNPETIRLLHAAMGLVTEAAELADMLKKHIFYGKSIDIINAQEEVGDAEWYCGIAIDVMKTTMNDILTKNIEKLRKRYPEKFTEDCAINRHVEKELEVFNK
jgi:NTP pyrophosphatase (non-canonical NTP hydrolase)